jgi:hypothetical protein
MASKLKHGGKSKPHTFTGKDQVARKVLANLNHRFLEIYVSPEAYPRDTDDGELLKAVHLVRNSTPIEVFVKAEDTNSLPGTFVVGRASIREKYTPAGTVVYIVLHVVKDASADGCIRILPSDMALSPEDRARISFSQKCGKQTIYVLNNAL